MKVKDLIQRLEQFPETFEVCFASTHEGPFPIDGVELFVNAIWTRKPLRFSGWEQTYVMLFTDDYTLDPLD